MFKNTHISTLCNWKTWKTTQESIKTRTDKCIILFPCEAATPLPLSFFRTMRVNKLATREPRLNLPNVASNKKGQTPTLRSEKLLLRETVAVSGGDRSLRSFHWPVSWHECWLQGWSHSSRLLSCLLMFQWHLRCSDYILHLDKNLNRRGWWKEWGEKGIEEEGCCLTWHYQELDSGKKGMDTGWHAWQLLQMGQEWSWMLKGTWCLALQGFPGQYTASDTPRKGLGARVSMAQSQQVTGLQQGGGINI